MCSDIDFFHQRCQNRKDKIRLSPKIISFGNLKLVSSSNGLEGLVESLTRSFHRGSVRFVEGLRGIEGSAGESLEEMESAVVS